MTDGPGNHSVRVTQRDIDLYAQVSGDFNPIHVDQDYAASARFGRTIAHGMLTLGVVTAALEEELGRAEWASGGELELRFRAPVFAGDLLRVDLVPGEPEPERLTVIGWAEEERAVEGWAVSHGAPE